MGPYVETTESAAPALLVLSPETILVRTTLCSVDTPCHCLTAHHRERPGEPVAGNLLGGFCEGGRGTSELVARPVPTHHRVNHDKLMGQIAKRAEDKRLRKLIRAFLSAGVMEGGLVSPSVAGTPQGGPLSPLLSNLVLDELDRELERRGHRYVRYADDCNIYVRSERAGQRVMESISRFITQKLKLKVNEAKSAVARPQERKFLGFSFTAGPDIKRTIAPKSLDRFKQRIRDITRRAKGVSIKTTMEELATYMRGWRGYFGFCETPEVLIALTRWVRLRLRAALWRQWKTPRRRRAALIANGVSEWAARNTAGSGRGPWYLARSRALSTGLSNAYFKSLGLPSLFQSC